jgi:DNA-binding NarL/FixJ family response regulator
MSNQNVEIILVDDHPLFREGIKLLIELEGLGLVIAEAENGKQFLELIEKRLPEIVIMDIDMPIMDGLEATQRAIAKYPDLKVLVLSMHGESQYYSNFIEAGVKGFALKSANKAELENAIKSIINGDNFFSQELLLNIISDLNKPKPQKIEINYEFTNQEFETLTYLCKGMSANEIAKKMLRSPKTIEAYRSKLLQKTETKNTLGLVLFAIKNKLVTDF